MHKKIQKNVKKLFIAIMCLLLSSNTAPHASWWAQYSGAIPTEKIPYIMVGSGLTATALSFFVKQDDSEESILSTQEKIQELLKSTIGSKLLTLHDLDVEKSKWRDLINKIYTRYKRLQKLYFATVIGTSCAVVTGVLSLLFCKKSASFFLAHLLKNEAIKKECSQDRVSGSAKDIVAEYVGENPHAAYDYPSIQTYEYFILLQKKLINIISIQNNLHLEEKEKNITKSALSRVEEKIKKISQSPQFSDELKDLRKKQLVREVFAYNNPESTIHFKGRFTWNS